MNDPPWVQPDNKFFILNRSKLIPKNDLILIFKAVNVLVLHPEKLPEKAGIYKLYMHELVEK